MNDERGQLRKVGALWKPKPGAKSKGSGVLTIGDQRQRFVVLPNNRKTEGSREPDYLLMSSDAAEPDPYAAREARPVPSASAQPDGDGCPF